LIRRMWCNFPRSRPLVSGSPFAASKDCGNIARLRRKLGASTIETVRGLGYRIRTES
jgi:hypothetical protein